MGHSPGIVQEKTINLRKNNKLYLHFILYKMLLKNRYKFEYPYLIPNFEFYLKMQGF